MLSMCVGGQQKRKETQLVPLRLLAGVEPSWASPFAGMPQHHPFAPPCTKHSQPPPDSRARSLCRFRRLRNLAHTTEWYLAGRAPSALPSALVRSPPHTRTHARPPSLPFPFSSSSPSLLSLTHRQLISRLRDLPFFLILYSLTLPAFFRLQPHSFGCPRRSFLAPLH